jgi:hypothetical protein
MDKWSGLNANVCLNFKYKTGPHATARDDLSPLAVVNVTNRQALSLARFNCHFKYKLNGDLVFALLVYRTSLGLI